MTEKVNHATTLLMQYLLLDHAHEEKDRPLATLELLGLTKRQFRKVAPLRGHIASGGR